MQRAQLLTSLGLKTDATAAEIREHYLEKSKEYHPDKNPTPEANAQFIKLKEMHDELRNLDAKNTPSNTTSDCYANILQQVENVKDSFSIEITILKTSPIYLAPEAREYIKYLLEIMDVTKDTFSKIRQDKIILDVDYQTIAKIFMGVEELMRDGPDALFAQKPLQGLWDHVTNFVAQIANNIKSSRPIPNEHFPIKFNEASNQWKSSIALALNNAADEKKSSSENATPRQPFDATLAEPVTRQQLKQVYEISKQNLFNLQIDQLKEACREKPRAELKNIPKDVTEKKYDPADEKFVGELKTNPAWENHKLPTGYSVCAFTSTYLAAFHSLKMHLILIDITTNTASGYFIPQSTTEFSLLSNNKLVTLKDTQYFFSGNNLVFGKSDLSSKEQTAWDSGSHQQGDRTLQRVFIAAGNQSYFYWRSKTNYNIKPYQRHLRVFDLTNNKYFRLNSTQYYDNTIDCILSDTFHFIDAFHLLFPHFPEIMELRFNGKIVELFHSSIINKEYLKPGNQPDRYLCDSEKQLAAIIKDNGKSLILISEWNNVFAASKIPLSDFFKFANFSTAIIKYSRFLNSIFIYEPSQPKVIGRFNLSNYSYSTDELPVTADTLLPFQEFDVLNNGQMYFKTKDTFSFYMKFANEYQAWFANNLPIPTDISLPIRRLILSYLEPSDIDSLAPARKPLDIPPMPWYPIYDLLIQTHQIYLDESFSSPLAKEQTRALEHIARELPSVLSDKSPMRMQKLIGSVVAANPNVFKTSIFGTSRMGVFKRHLESLDLANLREHYPRRSIS